MHQKKLSDMSNSEWQLYFEELRNDVKSSDRKYMYRGQSPRVNGLPRPDYFTNVNDTQNVYYTNFINGILRSIRRGSTDYCFHIYQILDLLQYEHDRLQAKWSPTGKYFEVSLARSKQNNHRKN